MDLKKHIIDTIKEWQLKIGYREGNMKLYYPGESLEAMLGLAGRDGEAGQAKAGRTEAEREAGQAETGRFREDLSQERAAELLEQALSEFCDEAEPQLGRIRISGSYERYCLEIPPKGCAYVAGKVPEPEFLKLFLKVITGAESTMEQVRECFATYGAEHGTAYIEEEISEEQEASGEDGAAMQSGDSAKIEDGAVGDAHAHSHMGHAFYFAEEAVEEYVYWVEENEFGLTYHRFTRADYEKLK